MGRLKEHAERKKPTDQEKKERGKQQGFFGTVGLAEAFFLYAFSIRVA
jgi:hypothetical protein